MYMPNASFFLRTSVRPSHSVADNNSYVQEREFFLCLLTRNLFCRPFLLLIHIFFFSFESFPPPFFTFLRNKRNAQQKHVSATTEFSLSQYFRRIYMYMLDKRQTNKSVGARFCSLTLEIFTWIKNSPLLFCNLFCFPFSLELGIQYGEGW